MKKLPKLTKKKLVNLSPSEIGKLKAPELRELLRGARNLFSQQEKKFEMYSKTVYSHSYEKMKDYYDDRGKKAASRMNINQMRGELYQLQDFFQSESSTVPGARKIQKEQDIRIFGQDSIGRPKKRMTVEQRTNFWKIYEEYKNLRPADVYEQSNVVQQQLGEMMVKFANDNLDFDLNMATLHELGERIEAERSNTSWEMDVEDDEFDESVFSGTWSY